MLTLFLSGVAQAGCGAEVPDLTVGGQAWYVDGTIWDEGTATVHLGPGFGFSIHDEGGRNIGVAFVGPVLQQTRGGGTTLGTGADDGPWTATADLAIGLGADTLAERTAGWTRVRGEGEVVLDLDAPDQPTILVQSFADLNAARKRAGRMVPQRARDLASSGYPLATMTSVGGTGWRMTDVHTDLDLGGLAGQQGRSDDSWLTTLVADPMLPSGERGATLALGTRHVDRLSGG